MGNRRDVITLAVLLAALAGIALLVRPYAGDDAADPRPSTYLTGPNGARALFLLMEELGVPAAQRLEPWAEPLPEGVLVVLAPAQPPTPRELEALLGWMDAGGTLIYGAGAGADPVTRALDLRLQPAAPDTQSPLQAVRWPGETAYATRDEAGAEAQQWSVGVDSVAGFRRTWAVASPALHAGTADVLLRTRTGAPVLAVLARGDGRAVVWSDASPLGNRLLRDGAAALLFARAVSDALAEGGALTFDEYHHGYRPGSPARALWQFVTGTGAGRALLQAALAGLLLLVLYGHRLGAPLLEAVGRRRSPLEHVDAVAAAYSRAGARRTARRLLVAGLERRLGRRILDPDTDDDRGGLDGLPGGQRMAAAWAGGGLVDLAAAVDDFEAEVRRWK
jgi:hypothetical protein